MLNHWDFVVYYLIQHSLSVSILKNIVASSWVNSLFPRLRGKIDSWGLSCVRYHRPLCKKIDTHRLCQSFKESNNVDSLWRHIMLLCEIFSRKSPQSLGALHDQWTHVSAENLMSTWGFPNVENRKCQWGKFWIWSQGNIKLWLKFWWLPNLCLLPDI